jgi:hypothetical protein
MVEAEVQNREAAKSEGSSSLSNLFLIYESAWQLAQVVIVGCVQRSSLRKSILDDQEGLSSDDQEGLSLDDQEGLSLDDQEGLSSDDQEGLSHSLINTTDQSSP